MRLPSQIFVFAVLLFVCLHTENARGATYDYIVVGGGATGAVIATRLARSSTQTRVLLLDAGKPSQSSVGGTDFVADSYSFNSQGEAVFNRPLTRYDVPAYTYAASADFPGSPTPYYRLDSNLGPYKTFTRLLGGNSVHNYMVWSRITPKALNNWNLANWSYNDLLPYFKKIEDVRGTTVANNPAVHGLSGPIEITNAQVPDPIGDAFIKSCVNAGYGKTADFNAPTNYQGCGDPQFNINRRGIRGGSINQYLAPTLKTNTNIQLITEALVTKILFDGNKKAIGVQYVNNGTTCTAYVNREVILSAGTPQTIKTLLLSGIGPAAQLNTFNIPVIADLPVGKNLSTHPIVFNQYQYNATGANPYTLSNSGVEYAINGTGLFASIGVPAAALLKSNDALNDIDLHVQCALSSGKGIVSILALRLTFQRDLEIKLQSRDPNVAPYLQFPLFSRNEDVVALANAIKIFRKIARTAPGTSYFGAEVTPGPAYQTDAQLQQWVRNGGGQPILTHLHGGAPMGNANDTRAVLDNRARVRKVTNLRVADSSIFPNDIVALPTNNLIAFAEKIADYIIEDNRSPYYG